MIAIPIFHFYSLSVSQYIELFSSRTSPALSYKHRFAFSEWKYKRQKEPG